MNSHDAKFARHKHAADQLFCEEIDHKSMIRDLQFIHIADLTVHENRVNVDFLNGWKSSNAGVYVYLADSRVVRAGSSATGLHARLRDYSRHINSALTGEGKTQTPRWEADLCLYVYGTLARGRAEIWVHESKPVESCMGVGDERIACKVDEYIITRRFASPGLAQPVLNRSSRIT